jgi:hypothetical protein
MTVFTSAAWRFTGSGFYRRVPKKAEPRGGSAGFSACQAVFSVSVHFRSGRHSSVADGLETLPWSNLATSAQGLVRCTTVDVVAQQRNVHYGSYHGRPPGF